jgi:hypothetical protein
VVTPAITVKPLKFDVERDTRETLVPSFDVGDFAESKELEAKTDPDAALEFDLKSGVVPIVSVAESHRVREAAYERRLGSLTALPKLRLRPEEYRGLSLDPSAGFLVANMDGICTIEMILDVAGMPRVEALRILVELLEDHVIELC